MKIKKNLFRIRKKFFKIISFIIGIIFVFSIPASTFSVSAAEGNMTDVSFSLAECYIYTSDNAYRPLVWTYDVINSTSGRFIANTWKINSSGDTESVYLPIYSEFVLRFVFSFSPSFQPNGSLVNSFDFTVGPYGYRFIPYDFLGEGFSGELRSYTFSDNDVTAQLVSSIPGSVISNAAWAFSSPESPAGVSISHYVLDLYCQASGDLPRLALKFDGIVISGGSGPEFPSYTSPDGSLITDYENAQSDLIGSLPDGWGGGASGSNFSDVNDTITEGLSTYTGAFAAVGNFFNDLGLNFNINALLMFSLGIGLVPLIVGMSINALRSSDRSYRGRRR